MNLLAEEKIKYICIFIIIILELIIIGLQVMCNECEPTKIENETVEQIETTEKIQDKESNKKIKVDIKGAVKKPGVYELENDARVSDVIKMAGGLKSNASTKYLNMSKKIADEMVIKIYTNNQIKNMKIVYEIEEECKCSTEDITECAGANIIVKEESTKEENISQNSNNNSNEENTNTKISLNNATKEELMTLNGIGESKANAIIEYRQNNNGFKTIEEIKNVSGIGEAAYNKIKDYITL